MTFLGRNMKQWPQIDGRLEATDANLVVAEVDDSYITDVEQSTHCLSQHLPVKGYPSNEKKAPESWLRLSAIAILL